jgi:translation initiation factor 3 subunit L
LNAFVKKSDIVATLEKTGGVDMTDDKSAFATHPLYRSLGYFSLIGLQRVHVLLADYHLALKVIAPIPLNKKGLYTKVIACYITLYYYTGYAYMMMRRFVDAIRTFAHILLYMSRIKQFHTKSYQYDAIVKRSDQMYALLVLLISTCPQRIDETISIQLRDRHADKMQLMQRGDVNTAEEVLIFGSPKFISPVPINWSDEAQREAIATSNPNQEALRLQMKTFINELKQQSLLPIIRSYLKLYTTIGIDKLAHLLERKVDEETLSQILLCYNHKTRGLAWQSSAAGDAPATNPATALGGKMTSFSDIAFYVEGGMIHISDTKAPRRYGDYFIRNANKFDDIVADLGDKEN